MNQESTFQEKTQNLEIKSSKFTSKAVYLRAGEYVNVPRLQINLADGRIIDCTVAMNGMIRKMVKNGSNEIKSYETGRDAELDQIILEQFTNKYQIEIDTAIGVLHKVFRDQVELPENRKNFEKTFKGEKTGLNKAQLTNVRFYLIETDPVRVASWSENTFYANTKVFVDSEIGRLSKIQGKNIDNVKEEYLISVELDLAGSSGEYNNFIQGAIKNNSNQFTKETISQKLKPKQINSNEPGLFDINKFESSLKPIDAGETYSYLDENSEFYSGDEFSELLTEAENGQNSVIESGVVETPKKSIKNILDTVRNGLKNAIKPTAQILAAGAIALGTIKNVEAPVAFGIKTTEPTGIEQVVEPNNQKKDLEIKMQESLGVKSTKVLEYSEQKGIATIQVISEDGKVNPNAILRLLEKVDKSFVTQIRDRLENGSTPKEIFKIVSKNGNELNLIIQLPNNSMLSKQNFKRAPRL